MPASKMFPHLTGNLRRKLCDCFVMGFITMKLSQFSRPTYHMSLRVVA